MNAGEHGLAEAPPEKRVSARPSHARARSAASLFDPRDDLVDRDPGRVDLDRVGRGGHLARVARVALAQVGGERVGAEAGAFLGAAAGALAAIRGEEHLHVRVGDDDGADVAALHDRVAGRGEGALALAQDLAHLLVARDGGDDAVDLDRADGVGHVLAGDRDRVVGVDRHLVRAGEVGERVRRRRGARRGRARARSARGTSRPCRGSGSRAARRASARRCSSRRRQGRRSR